VLYGFDYQPSPAKPTIVKLASRRAHSEPVDIAVYGNIIAVGDLMKGPLLLQYSEDEDKKSHKLTEIARTYQNSWSTAIELLDESNIIAADSDENLTIWQRDLAGVTDDDTKRLQLIGSMKIGELVTRIRRSMRCACLSAFSVTNSVSSRRADSNWKYGSAKSLLFLSMILYKGPGNGQG
jgi:DNA damage-binding protein 1